MNTLRIDVWFDVICPWCLIGKRSLGAALKVLHARRPDVAGPVLHAHAHAVARLEPARRRAHGAPHFFSNSATLRSISSRVRIFFSIRMDSMLAIQRS